MEVKYYRRILDIAIEQCKADSAADGIQGTVPA